MIAELVLIGTLQITAYRPIPSQTDDSPTWTSIGDRTTIYGMAVSQDLLRKGVVKYGEILCVDGGPCRVVNDCMGYKARRSVDLLVITHAQEKAIGLHRKKVWRLVIHE